MDEDGTLKRRHRPPYIWEPATEPRSSAVSRSRSGSQGGHDTASRPPSTSAGDCATYKLDRRPSLRRKSSQGADDTLVHAWRRSGTGSSTNPPDENADPGTATPEVKVNDVQT
jgi:hypothetical protein